MRAAGEEGAVHAPHIPLHLMGFAALCSIAAAAATTRSEDATALARSRCECDAMMSCEAVANSRRVKWG